MTKQAGKLIVGSFTAARSASTARSGTWRALRYNLAPIEQSALHEILPRT